MSKKPSRQGRSSGKKKKASRNELPPAGRQRRQAGRLWSLERQGRRTGLPSRATPSEQPRMLPPKDHDCDEGHRALSPSRPSRTSPTTYPRRRDVAAPFGGTSARRKSSLLTRPAFGNPWRQRSSPSLLPMGLVRFPSSLVSHDGAPLRVPRPMVELRDKLHPHRRR
ncbi:hypothetical protein MTO96_007535 [Rhipicephalus appendiculatus]